MSNPTRPLQDPETPSPLSPSSPPACSAAAVAPSTIPDSIANSQASLLSPGISDDLGAGVAACTPDQQHVLASSSLHREPQYYLQAQQQQQQPVLVHLHQMAQPPPATTTNPPRSQQPQQYSLLGSRPTSHESLRSAAAGYGPQAYIGSQVHGGGGGGSVFQQGAFHHHQHHHQQHQQQQHDRFASHPSAAAATNTGPPGAFPASIFIPSHLPDPTSSAGSLAAAAVDRDVCYTPYARTAGAVNASADDNDDVDYEALTEYLATGEVDGAASELRRSQQQLLKQEQGRLQQHGAGGGRQAQQGQAQTQEQVKRRPSPPASGSSSEKHSGRRDSKGFTGGKPASADHTRRFMFYSPACGVIRTDDFSQLSAEIDGDRGGGGGGGGGEEGASGGISEKHADESESATGAATGRPQPEPARLDRTVIDVLRVGGYWLDSTSPTAAEMKAFSKIFGLHPLTVEDIVMQEDREKFELFPNYYFVCIRTFDQDQYSATFMQPLIFYIVVTRGGVLSFHFSHMPHTHNVLRRIEQLKDHINVNPDWICYALIDDIADSFVPLIQQLEAEVIAIDELVLILKESEQADMLQRIGYARRNVVGLLRLLNTKQDVVKGLVKRLTNTSDIALYYGDILDHVLSMLSSLNYFEGILGRSHSNYLAQISIEITQSSNKTNAVLSKLTLLGSILLPMNLITGLWGMNVNVPGGADQEGFLWFGMIVLALVLFTVSCVVYLRKKSAI